MGICYLTIDDGPDASFLDKLNFLNEKGIKAIWYCQGDQLVKYETEAIEAVKLGHIIGNHSYDHPFFSEISQQEGFDQIDQTHNLIQEVYRKAGTECEHLTFRFPYLITGDRVFQQHLYDMGYRQPWFKGSIPKAMASDDFLDGVGVGTNFDTRDWQVGKQDENGQLFDGDALINRLRLITSEWTEKHMSQGKEEDSEYTVVLAHCFTDNKLFENMIETMLDGGMVFELPKINQLMEGNHE